jgi:hypothetical protein
MDGVSAREIMKGVKRAIAPYQGKPSADLFYPNNKISLSI